MEDLNMVNDMQEQIVDAQTPEEVQSEVDHAEPESTTEPAQSQEGVAKPQQTREENTAIAIARKQAEQQARALKAQNDRLMQALKGYGYEGDPDAIADALIAHTQGISQEEARAQREAAEAENAKYTALQTQADTYKPLAIEYLKSQDLAKLKSAYPENKEVQKLKSIDELGGEFFSLLSATHDPELAYDALQAKNARHTKPAPPDIGAVNSSAGKEKDFYTSEEVDKLTGKDYDNPKVMEAVRKSMLKWR